LVHEDDKKAANSSTDVANSKVGSQIGAADLLVDSTEAEDSQWPTDDIVIP